MLRPMKTRVMMEKLTDQLEREETERKSKVLLEKIVSEKFSYLIIYINTQNRKHKKRKRK